ncbi:hypothetical protein [Streptomyces sp. NPDC088923]|uniref:hypothetical protein n=1 Tax=Streptomyces sp. NPDC088923 TaxID=3365913 RepID=UPI00380E52EA
MWEPTEAEGGRLAVRWWKWAWSAPADRDPVTDETGEHADWNQPDDVWFLAGTYGGTVVRKCEIPAGRRVFLPVVNTVGPGNLLAPVPVEMGMTRAEATLNGKSLPLREYTSKPFRAKGLTRHVAWGLWSALDPLPPGPYVLEIRARSTGGFEVDTTYHLTAVA